MLLKGCMCVHCTYVHIFTVKRQSENNHPYQRCQEHLFCIIIIIIRKINKLVKKYYLIDN